MHYFEMSEDFQARRGNLIGDVIGRHFRDTSIKILEIGSSFGFLTKKIKSYGFNVTSVEMKKADTDRGNELGNYDGVDLHVCRVQDLDATYSNTFNVVIFVLALVNWVDIPSFYAKLHDLMLHDGQAWFYTVKSEWDCPATGGRHRSFAESYSFKLLRVEDVCYDGVKLVLNIWINEKH